MYKTRGLNESYAMASASGAWTENRMKKPVIKDENLFHLPSWGSWERGTRWSVSGSDGRWTSQRHRTATEGMLDLDVRSPEGDEENTNTQIYKYKYKRGEYIDNSTKETRTCSESFCCKMRSYSARTCSTLSAHILSAGRGEVNEVEYIFIDRYWGRLLSTQSC